VLPESEHSVSVSAQKADDFNVTAYIPRNLLIPVFIIRLGADKAVGTVMPKAAVNKNGNLSLCKYNVGLSGNLLMQPITSHAALPKLLAQDNLRLCILAPDTAHVATSYFNAVGIRHLPFPLLGAMAARPLLHTVFCTRSAQTGANCL
jgi:hypothetical protein